MGRMVAVLVVAAALVALVAGAAFGSSLPGLVLGTGADGAWAATT
jgi:hypothetical protein